MMAEYTHACTNTHRKEGRLIFWQWRKKEKREKVGGNMEKCVDEGRKKQGRKTGRKK